MTCGTAIIKTLQQHGVDTLFGVPGAQTYDLFDAIVQADPPMRYIGTRHEQSTAYMAFGYAKSTGRIGVYSVVPGPGMLNSSAALCTAFGASTPILCITGHVPAHFIGSGKGALHELPDQLATLRLLTKWAARIDHPVEAPGLVAEAFRQMQTGRPQPAALEIPWDVLGAVSTVELLPEAAVYAPLQPDPNQIDAALTLLKQAKNPMIMVGSGALLAADNVLELAELLQAPVVSFRSGRGIVSDDHYLGFNCAEGSVLWPQTDVLIAIGTRMELTWARWTGPAQPAQVKILRIDIDPREMIRHQAEVEILADAREATRVLAAAVKAENGAKPSRAAEYQQVKDTQQAEIQQIMQPQAAYLGVIRAVLPADGFFVEEVSQVGFTSLFSFPVYSPRTFVTCGYQGTLGFGFPTALGVKLANPGKAVVSVTGDGGFMFGVQELATAVQYGINLVTIVFNNRSFGNIRRDQQRFYNGRVIGDELRNPDFVALAESFGVAGYRVNTPAALQTCLEKALAGDMPALIEVEVERDSEASPWQFMMPGTAYGSVQVKP
jgi:acetolactate synthase-1/2/3 large subunit